MGRQGKVLFEAMRNIPGLHFQAVCDIWDYNRQYGAHQVRALQKHMPGRYVDIDEMLATEKGLDAAIIATPDCWHAPHAVKCLEAGLHVYCEKMMANTLDDARKIVRAVERTGKVCQIGYQRRSNPFYRYAAEVLVGQLGICGQITGFNCQWNRSPAFSQDIYYKKKLAINPEILERYGFIGSDGEGDMHRFVNWRLCRALSAGGISDLGSHQLDVCHWFTGGAPKSVMASGTNPHFKEREVFDDVMATIVFDTPKGPVQAFAQTFSTSSGIGGHHERIMGTEASINLSEVSLLNRIVPGGQSVGSNLWSDLEVRGFIIPTLPEPEWFDTRGNRIISRPSRPLFEYTIPGSSSNKLPHQPHLENFIAAIRGTERLNCDALTAFRSEVPVHLVEQAARSGQTVRITPDQLDP
jgi:predicted dehydrogenase